MKYWDLMDVDDFWDSVDSGYIRMQSHPEFPKLVIANYTEKAVFENWFQESPATKHSRGLVFNNDNGDVIARPFPKFFNYGQAGAPEVPMDMPVIATDKMDGSLGIIYPAPDGTVRVATRGSFASEQALHATRVLNQKYSEWVSRAVFDRVLERFTPLVEVIYPENRIVLDYDGADDLVLLGWRHIESGIYLPPTFGVWPGPRTATLPHTTFRDALLAEDRPNAEGIVVFIPELEDWVKIKQPDYVIKHKLVSNLSKRSVWESLGRGNSVQEICDPLPDEFHNYVKDVARELQGQYQEAVKKLKSDFRSILDELPLTYTRKDFAEKAKEADNTGWLFQMLDDKDYESSVWKSLRPEAER